ncbi:MAG: threonine synthase [Actinomycetia bacterium]|nr:threonine synthase [Actinomycetes bacterium]
MKFTDTRTGKPTDLAFSDVVVKGIAPTKGLFVPTELPPITHDELLALAELPYWQQAATIYRLFGVDFDDEQIDTIMQQAYGEQWDDEQVAPITTLDGNTHVLELYRGPTSAFKDMALQCMPLFLSASLEKLRAAGLHDNDLLMLVATSGDTGKAALDGFADRVHTNIIVFYPEEGVSDLQKAQMTTQTGDNVAVFGVRGNFDDCQNAVKATFADDQFNQWLDHDPDLALSSANSINWGRLMPQIVYYLSATARLMRDGKLGEGQLLDVAVPTGNFGNILAAWYAKQMGAPIGRLICASNSNNVLTDFIKTGTYDIAERPFFETPSPSMDILISSNLERLLYHLAGAEKTVAWMTDLKEKGAFTVDEATLETLQSEFWAGWRSDDESLDQIRRSWKKHHYLVDPHTAVGIDVAADAAGDNPVLVVSTAHWSKFAPSVLRALTKTSFSDPLPEPYVDHSDFEALDDVVALAPDASPVPESIDALRGSEVRFDKVIDATPTDIEDAVRSWVLTRKN